MNFIAVENAPMRHSDNVCVVFGQNHFLNDGLIEERENGPGVAPDMNDRLKAGFKR